MKAKSGPDPKKMLKHNETKSGFSGKHPAPKDGHRMPSSKPKGGSGRM
jgi:hypothetical protein